MIQLSCQQIRLYFMSGFIVYNLYSNEMESRLSSKENLFFKNISRHLSKLNAGKEFLLYSQLDIKSESINF